MKDPVETFTMQFANVKANSCDLHINVGKHRRSVCPLLQMWIQK